jgi:hypothetical protein
MAWIESHQKLEKHPKVIDLMCAMGWSLNETIGALHRFWWWCVDYAEDGDLRKHNDARIAIAVGLNVDSGKHFVESMVQSCWIDRDPYFRVHDWWQYIGLFLQIKYKHNPSSWKKIRSKYKNGSNNRSHNSTPNLTIPNLTKPTPPTPSRGFEEFWVSYPKKLAKQAALKAWVKLAPDEALAGRVLAALEKQRANPDWLKDNGQWVPLPASWINGRRWEDEIVVRKTADDVMREVFNA